MQLVLVAGFKASLAKGFCGPRVKLFAGKWRIITEHVVDTKLILSDDVSTLDIKHGTEFVSDGRDFWLSTLPGKEPFINVFVEYINGPNSPKPA